MEVGAVELLLVPWFCVFEFVNILLNYRGSQARYGRYDEAGITSSIWFSDAVGGSAARRSPYRDHPGVDSARPIGVVPLNGPGRALRLKISVASWRQIYAIAVNLIR